MPRFTTLFAALVLALFVPAVALAQSTPLAPMPTGDVVAYAVAMLFGLLAVLPRKISGTHVGNGRWEGFWHSWYGLAILTALPPVATAVEEAIFSSGLHWQPILMALSTTLGVQMMPTPATESLPLPKDASKSQLRALAWFLLPLALGAGIIVSCGPAVTATVKKVGADVGVCALDQVPAAVQGALPNVEAALQGSPTAWTHEQASLEAQGIDFALCAIKVAIADIMHHAGASGTSDPRVAIAYDRAQVYLAAHGK